VNGGTSGGGAAAGLLGFVLVVTGNLVATSGGMAIISCTTLDITGDMTPADNWPAMRLTSTSTVRHTGNVYSASNGRVAIGSDTGIYLIAPSANLQHTYRSYVGGAVSSARSLYTGGVNLNQPAVANVRSGTVFGASNEYTGTLAVPSASLVAIGVSVDNTTGTYLPNPQVLQQTTIATLASQTSFTLTAGSADNDVYNGQTLIVQDASTSTQKAVGTVLDYVGATKTITLSADPAIFTMAVGDSVSIVAGAGSSGGGSAPTASAIADEVQTRTIARVTLVDALTTYTGNTPQTGDSFARIGAAGAGLTSLAPAATALSTAVWTATIANRIDVAVSTRLAPLVAGRDLSVAATTGAVQLDSADKATLVDLIWDEPLTGATHNVANSSGKRLRQTTAFQQIDSTVIDASATTTTFVTGLTSSVDNFYNDSMLVFTDGALAGQVRAIYDYIGATKTIILEEALTSAPVNGVAFAVVSLHIHPVSQIQSGLATAAALATESTKINRIEAVATGTVTGAGTSTEVFVGPSATLTITVDASGNRSAVVVT
jgi:hypothetical protein